jgi:hypothetical protein
MSIFKSYPTYKKEDKDINPKGFEKAVSWWSEEKYYKKEDAIKIFSKLKSRSSLLFIGLFSFLFVLLSSVGVWVMTDVPLFYSPQDFNLTSITPLGFIIYGETFASIIMFIYLYLRLLRFDMANSKIMSFIHQHKKDEMISIREIGKRNDWQKAVFYTFVPALISWLFLYFTIGLEINGVDLWIRPPFNPFN